MSKDNVPVCFITGCSTGFGREIAQQVLDRFETNVFGLIGMTKAVLPGMRARRKGHIVNFSSIGGLVSFSATGYYHATKYAVEGLSESLALEVAPLGIKVLIVEPGPFRTDWAGRSIKQSKTRLSDYEPESTTHPHPLR